MTEEEKTLWEQDQVFYQQIWAERPHVCFESEAFLGHEPLSYMFHHVLEKEDYPAFRHCAWNIVLLSWEKHDQVHLDISKTPKVNALRATLLKQINHEPS